MADLPDDVIERLRLIFTACNARTTDKLSRNPNAPEQSFDLTWIEHLSRYSAPMTLPSEWLVKIETHYLGGMRHFRGWEIADIGVLIDLRLGVEGRRRKVALLQSKRLYPDGAPVREETTADYGIEFARLADPDDDSISIAFATEYRFDEESIYAQISANSHQVAAIDKYQKEVGLKVYYHLTTRGQSRLCSTCQYSVTTWSRRASQTWVYACYPPAYCTRALRVSPCNHRS